MEMSGISQGILEQGRLFVWGCISGGVLTFLYDLLRLWRRLVNHGQIWIAIEDVVFFVVSAMVGFQLLYPISLGRLRVFLVLSILVGSFLYHKLLGVHFIRVGTRFVHIVKKGFCAVFRRGRKKPSKSDKIPIEK